MINRSLAILTMFLSASACGEQDPESSNTDPRKGTYSVHSEVDADAINSEIYRDDVLVAVASLDADKKVITLMSSGKELVTSPPDDYAPRTELERYHDALIKVSTGLALTEFKPEVEFRDASACSYMMFDGEDGSICAVSWCSDGSTCTAIDCGPNIYGSGELHIMNGCK